MSRLLAVTSPSQLLWYVTRASGLVALVLLTLTVVLGVTTSQRVRTSWWPGFATQDLHRRISLTALVFLGIHIVTAIADPFAHIGWLAAIIPFSSNYRRLWLGLGTVSLDLLLAVAVTSFLRHRVPAKIWRALHWLAYGTWPVAVIHGLGTGTDPRMPLVKTLVIACVAAVLVALAWRLVSGWPHQAGLRVAGTIGAVIAVLITAGWARQGPLAPGWAARAGTPASILHPVTQHTSARAQPGTGTASAPNPGAFATSPVSNSGSTTAGSLPAIPYQATLTGTLRQKARSDGLEEVDISMKVSVSPPAVLALSIVGTNAGGGGVEMTQGSATYGPPSAPRMYRGQIVELEGSQVAVSLTSSNGDSATANLDLSISGTSVTGTVSLSSPLTEAGSDEGNST